MSLEQRVSRLEDLRVTSPALASEEDRINAATASVADYADFYVDEIVQLQDEFLAQAPFKAALITSPFHHRLTHDTAVAYPPDRPLPPETQNHFDEFVAMFELDVEEGLSQGWSRKRTPQEYRTSVAKSHAGAAGLLLACGGFDGLALLRRIWIVEDDHWVLIPEVWAAAMARGENVRNSNSMRVVSGLYSARLDGRIGDPNVKSDRVSYAEAAHFIGMPSFPVIDHTVVKSGQIRSSTLPRPWPSSHPESEVSTSIAGLPRRIAPGQAPAGEFSARPTGAGRAEFLVGNRLDPAAIRCGSGRIKSRGRELGRVRPRSRRQCSQSR